MPDEIADNERILRVNEIISQLILTKSKSTMIGRLSGGEKKRLAFATALLTYPNILLVDEPTSGLDTYLAKSLMNIIRSMAIEQNQTIVVILHQPTNTMFDLIDQICLIVEGGRQAFYGNKEQALDFFYNQCKLQSSSLDGFIEQLAAPPDISQTEDINYQQIAANEYNKSDQLKSLQLNIKDYLQSTNQNNINNRLEKISRTSFYRQLKWLLWRLLAGGKRNPKRTTQLVIRLFIMALVLGLTFFHLRSNPEDYIEKVNSLLLVSFMALLESNMNLMLVEIPTERALVIWEYRRQLYSVPAYYLSRLIVDTGYNIITATGYMGIILLLAGLPHWFRLICVMILILITACSFAVFIASISSTTRTALLTLQPTQNIFANLSGFFINLNTIPLIIQWIKYLSYFYYGYRLLLLVQWYNVDLNVSCKYFGYNKTLSNPNICPASGNGVLKCFNDSYKNYSLDIMALIIMCFAYHIASFIIILFRTKYNR
jgi:energy-coupling factor transporter ATP-binding protein EcfA2